MAHFDALGEDQTSSNRSSTIRGPSTLGAEGGAYAAEVRAGVHQTGPDCQQDYDGHWHYVQVVDGLSTWWQLRAGEHSQTAHGAEGGQQRTGFAWGTSAMEASHEPIHGAELGPSRSDHSWRSSSSLCRCSWEAGWNAAGVPGGLGEAGAGG